MRKRVGFAAVFVVALAALIPSAAAAGNGYHYSVLLNYCTGNEVVFKVREFAAGYTSANYITIGTKAQARTVDSSHWSDVYTWQRANYAFPRNGRDHSLTVSRAYVGNNHIYVRVVAYLRIWSGNTLLAFATVRSRQC